MLSCVDLAKTYASERGEIDAVKGIDIAVQPGEFASIVGRSGSGKSSFLAMIGGLSRPSRGTVRITSAAMDAPPEIAPNYLSTDEDRRIAADSLRLTRRLMAQAGLSKYHPEEFRPGPEVGDGDAELIHAAGDIGTTIFHPVGTAKMGLASDPLAVVDERLRVRGLENLRVIDASVMPTITSGNTNTPAIMIAAKGSEMVLEDAKR